MRNTLLIAVMFIHWVTDHHCSCTWSRPEKNGKWKLLNLLTFIGELMWTAFMRCFVCALTLCINSAFTCFNLYPSSSGQVTLELLFLECKRFVLCKVFSAGIFCVLVSTLVETHKAWGEQKSSHVWYDPTTAVWLYPLHVMYAGSYMPHTLHVFTVLAVPLLSHCVRLAQSHSLVLWRIK